MIYAIKLKFRQLGWAIDRRKHNFANWLIRPQAREFRDIVMDMFECETDDKLGPNPVELKVLTGHNQVVNIVNGMRKVSIQFMDQQVIVNCYARIKTKEGIDVVPPSKTEKFRETCSFMLPYNPEQLRHLLKEKK